MSEEWIELIAKCVIALLGVVGASAQIARLTLKWRLVWKFVYWGVTKVAEDFVDPVKATNQALKGDHRLTPEQVAIAQEMAVKRIVEAVEQHNANKTGLAPKISLDDDMGALLEKIETAVEQRKISARKGGKGAGA